MFRNHTGADSSSGEKQMLDTSLRTVETIDVPAYKNKSKGGCRVLPKQLFSISVCI